MSGAAPDPGPERGLARVPHALRQLPRDGRFLLLSGFVGALPFGFLQVFYPLYLHQLGWPAVTIGALLTLVGLSGALGLFLIGPLADRVGRHRVLLVGTALPLLGFGLLALTAQPGWLVAASLLSPVGYTGGLSGALLLATFFPLLSDMVPARRRTRVVSWAEAGLSLWQGSGMLLALLPGLLAPTLPPLQAARILFALCALLTLGATALLLPVGRKATPAQTEEAARPERVPLRPFLPLIGKIAVYYTLLGAGLGLTTQLLPLWFTLRFQTGTTALAPWFAATQLVSVPAVVLVPRLSRRLGTARVIVATAALGTLLWAGVAAAPAFVLAGLGVILRAAVVAMQWTAQQSFVQGCVDPKIRATVTSVTLGCWGVATALLPILAGYLLDRHLFVWPLLLGVACYGAGAGWFWRTLRHTELPEEAAREPDQERAGGSAQAAR